MAYNISFIIERGNREIVLVNSRGSEDWELPSGLVDDNTDCITAALTLLREKFAEIDCVVMPFVFRAFYPELEPEATRIQRAALVVIVQIIGELSCREDTATHWVPVEVAIRNSNLPDNLRKILGEWLRVRPCRHPARVPMMIA